MPKNLKTKVKKNQKKGRRVERQKSDKGMSENMLRCDAVEKRVIRGLKHITKVYFENFVKADPELKKDGQRLYEKIICKLNLKVSYLSEMRFRFNIFSLGELKKYAEFEEESKEAQCYTL